MVANRLRQQTWVNEWLVQSARTVVRRQTAVRECTRRNDETTNQKPRLTRVESVLTLKSINIARADSPQPPSNSVAIECPICYDSLKEKIPVSTVCGHVFCKNCILEVIKTRKACPICSRKLYKSSIRPIYLTFVN